MQALHRARDRLVAERTALINQLGAPLLERGVVLAQRRRALLAWLDAQAAAEGPDPLSPRLRLLVADMRAEWANALASPIAATSAVALTAELDRRIGVFDDEFAASARADEAARRVATIPRIGPRARDLAAWLGLVPKQATTGGKPKLLGITKRGCRYLRKNLIHGARSVMPSLAATDTRLGCWLRALLARAHKNTVVVALANKLARIVWAVLARGDCYRTAATS